MIEIQKMIYDRVKQVISDWHDEEIYAVSFLVDYNEAFSYRGFHNVSSFAVSYNTEKCCQGAGRYDEERWNYAFWIQNEIPIIDIYQQNPLTDALFDWYEENRVFYIGDENNNNDYNEFGEYIGKGPVGHRELLNIAAEAACQLQKEEFFKKKFGKEIPVIVHGLEYAWYDIAATQRANPNNEAKDFLKWIQ